MTRIGKTLLATMLAVSALGAMALASPAGAADDPVSSGRFDLSLSPAFKQRLQAKRVWVRARGLSIESGSVNPLTGTAALKLGGSLRFRHRGKTIDFEGLTATLGPEGALTGRALNRRGLPNGRSTKLFRLSGGDVVRDGFGARVTGVQASFGGARGLQRALQVHLPSGTAGSLAVQTQPETVAVLGGTATVTQDLSSGGIAPKLRAHCIDPASGVTPSGAASQPGGPGTPFQIPVGGGTISPNGWTAGEVDLSGGIDIEVGGPGLPSGCPTQSVATVHLGNFAVNVARKSVLSDFSVDGPYSPFPGSVIRVELQGDTSTATMIADPASHVLTANGAALGLDSTSVQIMNNYLPHASGGPVTPFAVGDVLGTAAMTVQSR